MAVNTVFCGIQLTIMKPANVQIIGAEMGVANLLGEVLPVDPLCLSAPEANTVIQTVLVQRMVIIAVNPAAIFQCLFNRHTQARFHGTSLTRKSAHQKSGAEMNATSVQKQEAGLN